MEKRSETIQHRVLELIAEGAPQQEILDSICELLERLIHSATASLMLYNPEANVLTIRHGPSLSAEYRETFAEITPGPGTGPCGEAVITRRTVIIEDTASHPDWSKMRHLADRFGIRACWSAPVFVGADAVGGALAILRSAMGPPSEEELAVLELAASTVGMVLRIAHADERNRDDNELLRRILDGSEDAIFVKDAEGRYSLVNDAAARYFGKTPAEIIGRRFQELAGRPQPPETREADQRCLEEGVSVVHEVEMPSLVDDSVKRFSIRRDPLRDSSGELIGIVGVGRDITEVRRVERAMQQTQKLESLGVLAGGIAHDFNNLLVGVLANVSLLEHAPDVGREELGASLAEIRIAASRAVGLTDRLLEYAGKRDPGRVPIDIEGLLRELPELLTGSLIRYVEFQLEIDGPLLTIAADATQLRQVLFNLVLNAAEATASASGGSVLLRARACRNHQPRGRLIPSRTAERGDWLEIIVSDQGPGMSHETAGRVFDPFFTTKEHGRGLGLASVLGIVDSHGGFIEVDSTEGVGSAFRLWLPATRQPIERPSPELPPQEPTSREGGRLLVVEDDRNVARLLMRILECLGYAVTHVLDAREALMQLEASDTPIFDLIIVDYRMPGMSGCEFLRRLRALTVELPVILTSGSSELEVRSACAPLEPKAFLRKPYTLEEVKASLEAASHSYGPSSVES